MYPLAVAGNYSGPDLSSIAGGYTGIYGAPPGDGAYPTNTGIAGGIGLPNTDIPPLSGKRVYTLNDRPPDISTIAIGEPSPTPVFSASTNQLDRYRVVLLVVGLVVGYLISQR